MASLGPHCAILGMSVVREGESVVGLVSVLVLVFVGGTSVRALGTVTKVCKTQHMSWATSHTNCHTWKLP